MRSRCYFQDWLTEGLLYQHRIRSYLQPIGVPGLPRTLAACGSTTLVFVRNQLPVAPAHKVDATHQLKILTLKLQMIPGALLILCVQLLM